MRSLHVFCWCFMFMSSLCQDPDTTERTDRTSPPTRNLSSGDKKELPELGKLGCHWASSQQLTNVGGYSLREIEYPVSSLLMNMISLFDLAVKEGVETFEQNTYSGRTFLTTYNLAKALTLGHPPELKTLHDDFRNSLGDTNYLIHEYVRVRARKGDQVFIYCQRGDLEISGQACADNIKRTCELNSWTVPSDPELKDSEVTIELLMENSLNRLSWVPLDVKSNDKQFVTEAYDVVNMGHELRSLILSQLKDMITELKIFTGASYDEGKQCNPWLKSALIMMELASGDSSLSEAESSVLKRCNKLTGELRIISDKRETRSLYSMLFADNTGAIQRLISGQSKSVRAENILHHNQESLHTGLQYLAANLQTLKEHSNWNWELLQDKLKVLQARQALGTINVGHRNTRLTLTNHLSSLHGQMISVRVNWDRLIGNLISEMENHSACNLQPQSSRIACKKDRSFITKVGDGKIVVKSRSTMMSLQDIALPQCLAVYKNSEFFVFKGTGHGFIKNGQIYVHQNLTVPASCVTGSGDNKLDCDDYLTPLGESEFSPLSKENGLMYLPVLEENPGIFLQSKDQTNVVSGRTSSILHHIPMFFHKNEFPMHIGGIQYAFKDFMLEHETYSQRFFLEVHEPDYFNVKQKLNTMTEDSFIKESWEKKLISQIAMKYRNTDPIFVTVSSLSGLMFLILMSLGFYCCCCRGCTLRQFFCCCCDGREGGKIDMQYYREHAQKYLPLYRGSSKQRNKDDPQTHDPFLGSSAPDKSQIETKEMVHSANRQLPLYPGPKPSDEVTGPMRDQKGEFAQALRESRSSTKKN